MLLLTVCGSNRVTVQRFIYAHGITTLLTNRSAAHARFEKHFEAEMAEQRAMERSHRSSLLALPSNASATMQAAHREEVAQRHAHEELVRKEARRTLNGRIMHHGLLTAMDELGLEVDDERRLMVRALFWSYVSSALSHVGNSIADSVTEVFEEVCRGRLDHG